MNIIASIYSKSEQERNSLPRTSNDQVRVLRRNDASITMNRLIRRILIYIYFSLFL